MAAEEGAGDEQLVLVDQALPGKGTDQAGPGFQQDFVDATGSQGLQQRGQVDLAIIARQAEQFVAGSGIARVIRDSAHHQGRAGLEERCVQRQAQAAIDQHALVHG